MPSKLLERLSFYYDSSPSTGTVMPAETTPAGHIPHWPAGNFGKTISPVNSVIIHETTGRPTYAYVETMKGVYTNPASDGVGPQLYISGNGATYQFIDIDPPRLTSHSGYMNGVSVGIENGDLGDDPNLGPHSADATEQARWRTLNPDTTKTEDLTGMKAFLLLHPAGAEEAVIIWLGTANYTGPQNASQAAGTRFRRMIFTEPNYRSLVLLCRYLAELLNIPRNFPVLPYLTMDAQSGAGSAAQVTRFRQFILCDERSIELATASGSNITLVSSNDQTLQTWYPGKNVTLSVTLANGKTYNFDHNTAWTQMMSSTANGYRGIAGHGFVGDVAARDSHSMCPGPFFDWHRFAREVWDWWWFPFDFVRNSPPSTTVQVSTSQRPYRKAGGSTPLVEYFFDAVGAPADYTSARIAGDTAASAANVFSMPKPAPVFAVANGVVVAARISNPPIVSTVPSNGFVLVRHEAFHLTTANKIDYDTDPTYVYSLTYYIDNPGVVLNNISDNNPDWYNRFLVRLTEAEFAVSFAGSHPADAAFQRGWARRLGGGSQRALFGDQVSIDAQTYRSIANNLSAGDVALFPLEKQPGATPVRMVLGDLIGVPGILAPSVLPAGNLGGTAETGVLVDIFTANPLPRRFTITENQPAARQAVIPAAAESWWPEMCGFVELETDPAKNLPADGSVQHYDMVEFCTWINGVTWKSEWLKYGITDLLHPDGPPRPKTRIGVV